MSKIAFVLKAVEDGKISWTVNLYAGTSTARLEIQIGEALPETGLLPEYLAKLLSRLERGTKGNTLDVYVEQHGLTRITPANNSDRTLWQGIVVESTSAEDVLAAIRK